MAILRKLALLRKEKAADRFPVAGYAFDSRDRLQVQFAHISELLSEDKPKNIIITKPHDLRY